MSRFSGEGQFFGEDMGAMEWRNQPSPPWKSAVTSITRSAMLATLSKEPKVFIVLVHGVSAETKQHRIQDDLIDQLFISA